MIQRQMDQNHRHSQRNRKNLGSLTMTLVDMTSVNQIQNGRKKLARHALIGHVTLREQVGERIAVKSIDANALAEQLTILNSWHDATQSMRLVISGVENKHDSNFFLCLVCRALLYADEFPSFRRIYFQFNCCMCLNSASVLRA
jgi:hypothetical protein